MTTLIWLHEDALSKHHPIFDHVDNDYKAFHIWDNDYFKQVDYGYNRLQFIYEAMSDLPFDIYSGNITDIITNLADTFQSTTLLVPETPNQFIQEKLSVLNKKLTITYIPDDDFIPKSSHIVEKRFFRFWNKIKKKAFLIDGKSDSE